VKKSLKGKVYGWMDGRWKESDHYTCSSLEPSAQVS